MEGEVMSETRKAESASTTILVKGILNSLLGTVHIVGAFTFEATKIAGLGTAEMRRDYTVWFYGVGAFVLFMGLLDLLCYQGLRAGMNWAWRISLFCAGFTTLAGLSGVVTFGVSPPLQLLVTGLIGLGVLAWSRRAFRERHISIETVALLHGVNGAVPWRAVSAAQANAPQPLERGSR
jgi:hypothetical protein